MKNKDFVLPQFKELSFKPIDSAYYDAKISEIKIRLNEPETQPVQPLHVELNEEKILHFNKNNNTIPNLDIYCSDIEDPYPIYSLDKDFKDESISNIYSNNFYKREKYLKKRKD